MAWNLFVSRAVDALFDVPQYHLDDGTVNANYPIHAAQWRRNMAGAIVLMAIANALMLTGLIFLYTSSARADDVASIEAQLVAEKIEQVLTTICMAEPGTVDAQLREYERTLQDRYRDLTDEYYEAPPCEILLKLRR